MFHFILKTAALVRVCCAVVHLAIKLETVHGTLTLSLSFLIVQYVVLLPLALTVCVTSFKVRNHEYYLADIFGQVTFTLSI